MTELRSRRITQGVARSPNRAMLRAVGFGDRDFDKPIIGVANAYSTITPCNLGLDVLAHRAEAALKAAGAMPQMFGTITVSDGISMGTEGMKYSLVSREVIADSIETACNAQAMDGLLAVGGCDKNMPGAMIAIARMDIPAVFVYGGTIKPGHYAGRDLTVVSVFEAVGEHSAGKIDDAELLEVERRACPGAGSCGGMFTANTMSSIFEAMGMSLPHSSTMAAEDAEKAESSARSAQVLVEAVRRDLRPRQILTRPAFENAIAVAMAIGGSTNAVLHLLAIAHAAGVPLRLDDFEALRSRVPVLCDLKPSGRFVAGDEDAAGARRAARQRALGHRPDDDGRATRRSRGAAPRSSGDPPVGSTGLPPRPPHGVARQPGDGGQRSEDQRCQAAPHDRPGARVRLGGGVPRRDLGGTNHGRRRARDPLRGPQRRARDARDAVAYERRRARWQPPAPRYTAGVLAKYARLVSSASVGAVTDLTP